MNRPNRSRSPSNARATAAASSAGSSESAGRSAAMADSSAGAWWNGGPRYWISTPGCRRRELVEDRVEPNQPGIGEAVAGGVEGERDRDDGDGARAGLDRGLDGGQGLVLVGGVADRRVVVVGRDGVGEGRERVGRRRIGVGATLGATELLDLVANGPPDVGAGGGGRGGRVGRLGDGQRGVGLGA